MNNETEREFIALRAREEIPRELGGELLVRYRRYAAELGTGTSPEQQRQIISSHLADQSAQHQQDPPADLVEVVAMRIAASQQPTAWSELSELEQLRFEELAVAAITGLKAAGAVVLVSAPATEFDEWDSCWVEGHIERIDHAGSRYLAADTGATGSGTRIHRQL